MRAFCHACCSIVQRISGSGQKPWSFVAFGRIADVGDQHDERAHGEQRHVPSGL
jgi:hypothetical protein